MADRDMHRKSVEVFRFTDPDAFVLAHDASESESEYIRLSNTAFQAELIHFDLGAFRIRLVRFSPPDGHNSAEPIAIVRAACKSDRATLRMPVGEMTGSILNGREVGAGDLIL